MTEISPPGPDATVIEAIAHGGRACRFVDGTGTIAGERLERLLDALIAGRHFGFRAVSAGGSPEIRLGAPEFTHMQFGDRPYRMFMLLFPNKTRLEAFG